MKGPEHYRTAGGYYQMGIAFLKQDSVENALSFFDKVVDIWYKFLMGLRSSSSAKEDSGASIRDVLDDAEIGDAASTLRSIVDSRGEFLGNQHIATGEASYVLGMIMILL